MTNDQVKLSAEEFASFRKSLGERVAHARKEKGLTQEQLAVYRPAFQPFGVTA